MIFLIRIIWLSGCGFLIYRLFIDGLFNSDLLPMTRPGKLHTKTKKAPPIRCSPINSLADDPKVSIHYARLVAREVGAKGKTLHNLLIGSGVSPAHFMDEEALLTTDQTTQIALNAMALCQDPGLGLRVGRLLAPETYGPLGFLVSSSPNLKVAIEHFKTLLPTRIPFVDLQTEYTDEGVICHLGMRYTNSMKMFRGSIDCIAVSLLSIITSISGDDLEGLRLFCHFSEPDYSNRYKEFLPIAMEFNASSNRLFIPEALLLAPNPIASKANYQLAMQQCQSMIQSLAVESVSVTNKVKEIMLSAPPGTVMEDHVAQALFISKRTLARRLTAENTTFQSIRDEILASIAVSHLLDSRDTVESIAALLNYHDASNFRRAFKRWFTMTPEQYRNHQDHE